VSVVTGTPREPEEARAPHPTTDVSLGLGRFWLRRGVEEVVEVRIRERVAGARTSRIGDFRITVPGSEVGS
jgi:hypothetical protein